MERLIKELESIAQLQSAIKAQSMIFQYDLKAEVAKFYGLTVQDVDLPYQDWCRLQDQYMLDKA